MLVPFDNPEIAAASRKRGGGGRVANAAVLPVDPAMPVTPRAPSCRGVFVSAARAAPFPCATGQVPGRAIPAASAAIPRAGRRRRGRRLADQEVSMFEGQPQAELDAMMKANSEFRQLYFRHRELDKQVLDAELGVLPIDDTTLGQMKREKLAAKQRLLQMYERAN
jgi:uncharacterized protein YdcH (DUF465 family)